MPTLYTITYKRTNKDNQRIQYNGSAGSINNAISNFSVSGNGVGKVIGQVVSVSFGHYHTWTGYTTINIRSVLKTRYGDVYSDYVSQSGNTTNGAKLFTNTFTGVTAQQAKNITGVTLEWQKFNSSSDLYYRATSSQPQTITITFYEASGMKYFDGENWVDCQAYYYDGSNWVATIPYYYNGTDWIQLE